MNVENWPIDRVKPYSNNPRKNDEAVEKVANSIKSFGWQQPIVVDSDGVVIVGHTRLKAAHMLGLSEVPVTVAEGLSDNQVQAYRLADNKTGELADWDWGKLDLELEAIDWLDVNMEDFGFKLYDGEGILAALEEEELIASSTEKETDSFMVSIILPLRAREAFESFVRDNGKQPIVDLILAEVGA